MSNRVAFKKQQRNWRRVTLVPVWRSWFVLKDKTGKVRDWVHACDQFLARQAFKEYRNYNGIPKGYTIEKRGPVTAENW